VRMAISFNENFTVRNLERLRLRGLACAQACRPKKGQIMKYALISSLSLLAIIVGTEAANAQAEINPNIYPPYRGAPAAQQVGVVFHAGSGPPRQSVRSRCRRRSRLRVHEGLPRPEGFGSPSAIAGRSPFPSKVGTSVIQIHASDG
jgi:hypothetical protein